MWSKILSATASNIYEQIEIWIWHYETPNVKIIFHTISDTDNADWYQGRLFTPGMD